MCVTLSNHPTNSASSADTFGEDNKEIDNDMRKFIPFIVCMVTIGLMSLLLFILLRLQSQGFAFGDDQGTGRAPQDREDTAARERDGLTHERRFYDTLMVPASGETCQDCGAHMRWFGTYYKHLREKVGGESVSAMVCPACHFNRMTEDFTISAMG